MKLKAKILSMEAGGKAIVVLNRDDADELGVRSLSRVQILFKNKYLIAIVDITDIAVKRGYIGVFDDVVQYFGMEENAGVDVDCAKFPRSLQHIKNKIKGRKLMQDEIFEIVQDTVDGRLNEIELAAFVTALDIHGLDLDEVVSLANAMVATGEKLELNKSPIVDKHSIGGVPGDKTTILLVPIIAACGLTIPKTSSRAITSAAGTADRAEVLMPVQLSMEEMKVVVRNTGGCIVWGGAMHLAPADDKFVQIEYPLAIDPLMMPSIMSKKKAVGAEYLVIDMPCGRGSKLKTIGDANLLARDFIEVGRRLDIKTHCLLTYGEQPLGYSVGPALEAREALEVIMRKRNVPDLIDKATRLSGAILEMTGKAAEGVGRQMAMDVIKSGKAEDKLREIIFEQGGDNKIKPEDIEIGKFGYDVTAPKDGNILWVNNFAIASVARACGSPRDKGAGFQFYKKIGEPIKKGEKMFTIYADKAQKLNSAIKLIEEDPPLATGKERDMVIEEVKEVPIYKKSFILER